MGRVTTFEANDLSGLVGWYRAEMGPTYESGTTKALQWHDLSGLGHHLLQATSAARPVLAAGPLSRPVLLLDGVDDFMQAVFTLAQPATLVIVYKSVATGAAGSHNYIADGGAQNSMSVQSATTPAYTLYAGGSVTNAAAIANNVYACTSNVFNGASAIIRVNGAQVATGNAGAAPPNGLTLGSTGAGSAAYCSNTAVAEVALYNRVLTTAEMVRLERSLGQRYGIGVA